VITGLDHVAVAVADVPAAADGYRRLLGREPDAEGRFQLANTALRLIPGEAEGLVRLGFAVDDLDAAARLLERRGLSVERADGETLVRAAGLIFSLHAATAAITVTPAPAGVDALDHVVVHTPNPDRALAVFGAKLGLDLRLDRENLRWNARQLFFRCGQAVVEVGARLAVPPTDDPDSFGGLAWRVYDAEAARARLTAAGFDVSEVRTGRKPGTKVFTVRDAPAGIPTLMLQPSPALEPA
jgi:catechol 2,3-dioxygenase-like lactoylglutathione lyase family enzyme